MHVAMAAVDGSSAWNFYLVSYHNPDDLPPIPAVTPTAAFTYVKEGNVVEFTNASSNATSYLWDFGDGATSTDLNPVHIYAGDGDYTVTLTAFDDAMMSGETSQVISISSAVFTAADLSSQKERPGAWMARTATSWALAKTAHGGTAWTLQASLSALAKWTTNSRSSTTAPWCSTRKAKCGRKITWVARLRAPTTRR